MWLELKFCRSVVSLAILVIFVCFVPSIVCQDGIISCKDFVEKNPSLADDDISVKTSKIRIINNSPLTFDWTRMFTPKEALVCFKELSFYCGAFQNETVFKEFLYKNISKFPSTGDTSPVEVPTECFCHEKPRMYIIAKLSRFLPVSNRTLEFHVDLLNNVSCAVVGQWECNKAREDPLFASLSLPWNLELKTFYQLVDNGVSAPLYVLDWANIFNVPKLPICFDTISFHYQGDRNSSNATDYKRTETKYPRSNHDLNPMLLEDVCGNQSFALIEGVFATSQGDALFTKVIDVKNFNVDVPACPSTDTLPPPPPPGPGPITPTTTSPETTTTTATATSPSATPATTTAFQGDEETNNNFIIFLVVTLLVMFIILLLLCCLCCKMRQGVASDTESSEKYLDTGSEKSVHSDSSLHPPHPMKKQESWSPSAVLSPLEKPSQSKATRSNSTPNPKKELRHDRESRKWYFVDIYEY